MYDSCFTYKPSSFGYSGGGGIGYINLWLSTENVQFIVLKILKNLGSIGNLIFFVCSVWFLCDDEFIDIKKPIKMILDVWIVSVIWLVVCCILGIDLELKNIVRSLLPTLFANNWYITYYLMIYAVHPFLNWIIWKASKRQLAVFSMSLFVIYFGFAWIKDDLFGNNFLVHFLALYFIVAYIKKYGLKIMTDRKCVCFAVIFGAFGVISAAILINYLGLQIPLFQNKTLMLATRNNPFSLIFTVGLFFIFIKIDFVSFIVNRISSTSLLVYIIHENLLFKTYIRPYFYVYVYETYGYNNIVFWTMVLSTIIFGFSFLLSIFYQFTIQKITSNIVAKLVELIHRKNISQIIDF